MRYFKPSTVAVGASLCAALFGAASAQTIERVRLTDNDLNCTQIYAEVQQMDSMIQLAGSMPNSPVPAPQAAYPAYPVTQAPQPQQMQPPQMAVPQGNFAFQGAVMADPQVRASIARARAAGMSDQQIAATLGVGMQRAGLPQMPAQVQAPSAGQAYAQAGGLAGMLNSGMAAQGGSGNAAAGFAGIFGAIASAANQSPAPAQQVAPAMPVAQVTPQASPQAGNIGRQAQARKEHLTTMFLSKGCKLADVQR